MNKTCSTLDFPVCRVNQDRNVHQIIDTHNPLFAQQEGRMLIQELVKDGFSFNAASSTMGNPSPVEEKTMPAQFQNIRLPRVQRVNVSSRDRYILLKKFEGFVTSRGKTSFVARLFENTSDYPVIEAEFDLEELSATDRELAIEGASLVWTIGYRYEGNTCKRESMIYLRRLPPWSEKEIVKGRKDAEQLMRGIQWE